MKKIRGQNSCPGTSKFEAIITLEESCLIALQYIKNPAWLI